VFVPGTSFRILAFFEIGSCINQVDSGGDGLSESCTMSCIVHSKPSKANSADFFSEFADHDLEKVQLARPSAQKGVTCLATTSRQ
jgi:hypothetical protein